MKKWWIGFVSALIVQAVHVGITQAGRASAATSPNASAPLILGAAPRFGAKDMAIFDAMAAYLSGVIHRQVVFQPAPSFSIYQGNVQTDQYDLVVDGAHLTGWRVKKRNYDVLARMSGEMRFVVITPVKSDITAVSVLAGRTMCTMNPPNLGFLVLRSLFSPLRQPGIRPSQDLADVYNGVRDKKCDAGILPLALVKKLDPTGATVRIIYQHEPILNEALSAGKRVTAEEKRKITEALLSSNRDKNLELYQASYMLAEHFVKASNSDYIPFARLLDGEIGF
jgi:hypothetical protein